MMPTHFDPETDLAPMSFSQRVCHLALDMKVNGLEWNPHVGCFVWDPDHHIAPDSPFPGRIYFILSLPRFIDLLGSREAISEKLVWLPTWHQARLLCQRLGIADEDLAKDWQKKGGFPPCEDLADVYLAIINGLQNR